MAIDKKYWNSLNKTRHGLIEKKYLEGLTDAEDKELERITEEMDNYLLEHDPNVRALDEKLDRQIEIYDSILEDLTYISTALQKGEMIDEQRVDSLRDKLSKTTES